MQTEWDKMKTILIFISVFAFSLWCTVCFAGTQVTLPEIGTVTAPTETMIWMFVMLMLLNILSKLMMICEDWLKARNNFLLRGFGYIIGSLRFSLDGIIANTRRLKQ